MRDGTYKWYLLGLLVLIQAFSPVDRLALSLLTQDIKADLSLTDTQLGALDGIAFALFFGTMGIPLARWADRGHRGRIMAVTTALWSVAVMLCAVTRSFLQMALSRLVAGVGEAGCDPTSNSLVCEYFDRGERTRAMTISTLSSPLGMVIGYGAAGWIGQHYGWRATFVALGLPGLLLAVIAALTMRESRTSVLTSLPGSESQSLRAPSLRRTCATLWKNASFRHLAVCYVLALFFNYALYTWLPAFFVRSHGMNDEELGVWLAATNGVAGFVGTYVGGELAQRYARNNEPLQLKWMAILLAVSTVVLCGVFVVHDRYAALGLMGLSAVLSLTCNGPMWAVLMTIVPERMRATSTAVLYLLGNLIGMGLGPVAAGALSDFLHPFYGDEALRYVLLILAPGYFWAAWHTWAPHKTVLRDIKLAELDVLRSPEQEAA